MAFRRRMIYLLTFLVNTTVWRVGGTAVTFFFCGGARQNSANHWKHPYLFWTSMEEGNGWIVVSSKIENLRIVYVLMGEWAYPKHIYFIYIFCIHVYCFRLYFRPGKTYHEGILSSYLNQCRVSMGFLIPTCGGHVMYHGISTPGAVKEVVKEPKPNWHPWCGGSLCFHKWNMSRERRCQSRHDGKWNQTWRSFVAYGFPRLIHCK